MKRMLALLTALCLVCLSAAAFAETVVADGSPLVLDGFTLNLEQGAAYELNDKTAQQLYIMVYPYAASGDSATNFNAVWSGEGNITADLLRAELPELKSQMESGFREAGFEPESIEYSDPCDGFLAGAPCVTVDTQMTLSVRGYTINMMQRQFYVGSRGFIFTASAMDQESLEALTATINDCLVWQ